MALGECLRGAHEFEAIVLQVEVSIVRVEGEVGAIRHGGLCEVRVRFHGLKIH